MVPPAWRYAYSICTTRWTLRQNQQRSIRTSAGSSFYWEQRVTCWFCPPRYLWFIDGWSGWSNRTSAIAGIVLRKSGPPANKSCLAGACAILGTTSLAHRDIVSPCQNGIGLTKVVNPGQSTLPNSTSVLQCVPNLIHVYRRRP